MVIVAPRKGPEDPKYDAEVGPASDHEVAWPEF